MFARLLAWFAAARKRLLSHLHDQEGPGGNTGQRTQDAEYDDRQSMSSVVQEKQSLESLAHQRATNKNNDDTTHQRELVKWTRNLAYTTGALALATFIVACLAGWQAWEMRSGAEQQHQDTLTALGKTDAAITETRRLADEAKRSADNAIKTAERELRAYVGVVGDVVLKCPLCDTADADKPIEISREHMADNVITTTIENGGRTPAYNIFVEDSYWSGTFGQRFSANFTFPINSAPLPFPFPPNGTGTLNPRERTPEDSAIDRSVIPLIIRARQHIISLFYYGNVNYKDVFRKSRATPFCFEYLPDNPVPEQFVNCPEHNSPEQDK
jgi:hypothetical protein